MMAPIFNLCYLCIVFVIRTRVFCFNIESRDPVIKRGLKGSYFGYSVALHKTRNNTNDIDDSWLLVGAPLGQNMQPETYKSGTLFKCPLRNFESQTDCEEVPTDGRRSADSDYDEVEEKAPMQLLPPGNDEMKNGQWLGVNVRSQGAGGKVMVCAHRYIWSQNLNLNQYGLGLCYSLNNFLEWEEQWEPCKGRPMLLEHQQFGYCQAGTSLAVLKDGTALIGSPGPFTWRGTLFVLSISSDFLKRDKNVYLGPLNDKPDPINKYSYLGMSVAAGRFFNEHKISYAAGAPRSQDNGEVYIFNKHHSELEMNISLRIQGEQFASNFGYELLSGDFNNDGFDDLLISAPFYFEKEKGGRVYIYYNLRNCNSTHCNSDAKLNGKLESRFGIALTNLGDINRDGYNDLAVGAPYEEPYGAIYIYLGGKDGIATNHSQKIYGLAGSRTLGYSLSGGLDMDNNGYPDLLAGAYDADVVLLFRTRPIFDINIEVTGKELKNINIASPGCAKDPTTPHKCFSFNACFTIDSAERRINNVTIRCNLKEVLERGISRVWFRVDDPNIQHNYLVRHFSIQKNQKRYCQEETLYFRNNTRDILTPIKFKLNYTIANNEPHSAILNRTSEKDFEATFQKDCGSDDECQSNMVMTARLLLNETINKQYILTLGGLEEFHVEINVTNDGDPAYEAKAFVIHPPSVQYIAMVNTSRSVKCSKKNDTIVACDLGNPLHTNKSLSLQLRFETKDISNQSRGSVENELNFSIFVNSTSVELSKQTKAQLVALISRKAEVKLSSGNFTKTVVYSGEIKGESAMHTFDDIGTTVLHSYQIQQFGPMKHADLLIVISWPWQVGNDKPQGKWLLYLEDVSIIDGHARDYCYVDPDDAINYLNLTKVGHETVPVRVVQNETSISPVSSYENVSESTFIRKTETTYTSHENSLFESFSSSSKQENEESFFERLVRRRRDTDYVVPADIVTGKGGKSRKVVTMDCKTNTAKCVTIYCEFPKFAKGRLSTVVIKSRLWNSTFVEDYSQVDWVRIVSYGNITFMDESVELHERSHPVTLIETNAYPDLSIQVETDVPLWVIILAVVAGLILLILLILILWRVGFFKRNRIKDPTLSGNLTKQSEQETLLNK